jgi:hypothetical protein
VGSGNFDEHLLGLCVTIFFFVPQKKDFHFYPAACWSVNLFSAFIEAKILAKLSYDSGMIFSVLVGKPYLSIVSAETMLLMVEG